MRDLDKFKGSLIGGAAGDALGYAVEFMSEGQIFKKYGTSGITEYSLTNGQALISDDTQMTLFTANGLLLGTTRGMMRGIMGTYPSYISFCYKEWYKTQTEKYPLDIDYHYTWLSNIPELFSRRSPGNTCLSAISHGCNGTVENPINTSKGCGGIMRVAPIGLYFVEKNISPEEVMKIGAETAALTHGHELGYIPAAALVHIIFELADNEKITVAEAVENALALSEKLYKGAEYLDDFVRLIHKAVELADANKDDLSSIHTLGEGWVAEETLAIAVYCAIKYENDFEKCLIAAVNHNGDSDSTGAVVGNILGAKLGFKAIPQKFVDNLELKDVILEIADDLYNDCQMSEYDYQSRSEVWERKYISNDYAM